MRIKSSTVERYLERYAEPASSDLQTAWQRSDRILPTYDAAVVVPIFAEANNCIDHLLSRCRFHAEERYLVIAVVNEPQRANAHQRECNRQLLRTLREQVEDHHVLCDELTLLPRIWRSVDVLLVDATQGKYAFEERDGVGRARKLGADLALTLYEAGTLKPAFLGSSDADAALPPDYFRVLSQQGGDPHCGLVFPFEHVPAADDVLDSAMAQVEASFRYYVLGLHEAGSPYAYHSLGSALAISLPHYAAVRGFPLRQAGEDFYLLSKLVQLAPLKRLAGDPIHLLSRTSDRVPFGTGPRLARLLQQSAGAEADLLTYDPRVFTALTKLLARLVAWSRAGGIHGRPVSHWLDEEAVRIFSPIAPALASCSGESHRMRRLFESFDALSTLQFVRRLTDRRYPLVPLRSALGKLTSVLDPGASFDPRLACERLRRLEQGLPLEVGPWASKNVADLQSSGLFPRRL